MAVPARNKILTWRNLLVFILAYNAGIGIYRAGEELVETIAFVAQSQSLQGSIIDTRSKEEQALIRILPSGHIVFHATPLYNPIVSYKRPNEGYTRQLELSQQSPYPYTIGQGIDLRVSDQKPQQTKESHGLHIWGGVLLKLLINALLLLIAYHIYKKGKRKVTPRRAACTLPQATSQAPSPSRAIPAPRKKRVTKKAADKDSTEPSAAKKPKSPRKTSSKNKEQQLSLELGVEVQLAPKKKKPRRPKKTATQL